LNLGPLSRENRSRRKLHASKEESCQEKETLTESERYSESSEKPPERSTSPGVFFVDSILDAQERYLRGKMRVVLEALSC
jgi:hypothetical protein